MTEARNETEFAGVVAEAQTIATRLDLTEAHLAAFAHLSENTWRLIVSAPDRASGPTRSKVRRFVELNRDAMTRAEIRVVE